MLRLTVVVVILALAAGLATCLVSGSVLWRVSELDAVEGNPLFVLFNPLRDRAPERTAAEFLSELRDGSFEDAFGELPGGASAWSRSLEREGESRFSRWELWDRSDQTQTTILLYALYPEKGPGIERLATIVLQKEQGAVDWGISGYRTLY